jgi:hypothetical protein
MARVLLLMIGLMVGTITTSFAQIINFRSFNFEDGVFNAGIETGLPVGSVSKGYNLVIGASFKYEYPVSQNVYVTASAGYNAFLTKTELKRAGLKSLYSFVPLKAGLKYYIQDGLFAEGQLGMVFSINSGGGLVFAYSPGAGYSFDNGFEAGLRYEGWPKNGITTSQIGLRLGYQFK